eukprot:2032511-Rhodomonas_salina.3
MWGSHLQPLCTQTPWPSTTPSSPAHPLYPHSPPQPHRGGPCCNTKQTWTSGSVRKRVDEVCAARFVQEGLGNVGVPFPGTNMERCVAPAILNQRVWHQSLCQDRTGRRRRAGDPNLHVLEAAVAPSDRCQPPRQHAKVCILPLMHFPSRLHLHSRIANQLGM